MLPMGIHSATEIWSSCIVQRVVALAGARVGNLGKAPSPLQAELLKEGCPSTRSAPRPSTTAQVEPGQSEFAVQFCPTFVPPAQVPRLSLIHISEPTRPY